MVKVVLLDADQESHSIMVPAENGSPLPEVVIEGDKAYVRQFAAYGGIFMYTEATLYEAPKA